MTESAMPPFVEYGALTTAPGPLLCERARLYTFFLHTDHARVQDLCDRVLSAPTGGALRYRVPHLAPVVLSFGTIGGLRSLDPTNAGRGSAFEPEAAIWVPTIAQRLVDGSYVDDHTAIFMPYIWVDDPIAFASGREVYGFAKSQGWMRQLEDPRGASPFADPPDELFLDVYGTPEYHPGAELGRTRLLTLTRGEPRRGGGADDAGGHGETLGGLVRHYVPALGGEAPEADEPVTRGGLRTLGRRAAGVARVAETLVELMSEQVVRHVFLKQFRDAQYGDRAVLQQVVETRSSVVPGTLRWRRLHGEYALSVTSLASQPLGPDLGLPPEQVITRGFAAEFGFRMDPGEVRWPAP